LPSVNFWQAQGFEIASIEPPHNRRQRAIYRMTLDLWPALFALGAGDGRA